MPIITRQKGHQRTNVSSTIFLSGHRPVFYRYQTDVYAAVSWRTEFWTQFRGLSIILELRVTYCYVPNLNSPCSRMVNVPNSAFDFLSSPQSRSSSGHLMKCYIRSISVCGAGNWTLRKIRQNCLVNSEMLCWRRTEKNGWTGHVRNEDVLRRVNEEKNILHTVKKKEC